MKNLLSRGVAFVLVSIFATSPVWATCGGGGGGGGGGMSGGNNSGDAPAVYHVPWKMHEKDKPVTTGLILYWFPATLEEIKKSPMLTSRDLSLYAAQCVRMELADGRTTNAEKLTGTSKAPFAVLADPAANVIGRVDNKDGKIPVGDVEKLVGTEIKSRKTKLEAAFKDAKAKETTDKDAAIKGFQAVIAEKCMFADKAKDAAKELKKLGVDEKLGQTTLTPNFDPQVSATIVRLMTRGLVAENAGRYILAEQYYSRARTMDLADPTPLRYLAELHRHHIGNWMKAKREFRQILEMPADPLSRAVALHGLGKITIHEGDFKKGLHLMEDSVAEYPTSLAYRNLAVYWASEHDMAKADYFTTQAMTLDPEDTYTIVFAAVYKAMAGHKDEAIAIADKHIDLLPASYNLAAIYAVAGERQKALSLLKRHFYKYERYDGVRSKEMMEARVDTVFDSLRADKDFLALTRFADGRLPMPTAASAGMSAAE